MANFQPNNAMLKIVFLIQFTLSSWSYMQPPQYVFLPPTYMYIHTVVMFIGVHAIAKPGSSQLVLLYMLTNFITLLNDIIILALFQPPWEQVVEHNGNAVFTPATVNTGRFALGMYILDVILRPFFCVLLYFIYKVRGGDIREEIQALRGSNDADRHTGYDSLDNNVEQAPQHHSIDS